MNDGDERRVYILSSSLCGRLRTYQRANGISSETEAVRRLLDYALQMRDTLPDILARLNNRLTADRDLRATARDLLAPHPLVARIAFDAGALRFELHNGEVGNVVAPKPTDLAGASA